MFVNYLKTRYTFIHLVVNIMTWNNAYSALKKNNIKQILEHDWWWSGRGRRRGRERMVVGPVTHISTSQQFFLIRLFNNLQINRFYTTKYISTKMTCIKNAMTWHFLTFNDKVWGIKYSKHSKLRFSSLSHGWPFKTKILLPQS